MEEAEEVLEDVVVGLTRSELKYLGITESMFDLISRRPGLEELREQLNNLDVGLIFEDCPNYGCTRGKLFDLNINKWVRCPQCAEKVKKLTYKNGVVATLEDGRGVKLEVRLSDLLNIDPMHFDRYKRFDFDRLFSNAGLINTNVKNRVKDIIEDVYNDLVLGRVPECSYCFGLGNSGNIEALVYPFLIKAFLVGLTIARFASTSVFFDFEKSNYDGKKKFKQFMTADVCIVLLIPTISFVGVSQLKALMQERAIRGKSTIFVTTENEDCCSSLINYSYDVGTKFSATPVFVKYDEIVD